MSGRRNGPHALGDRRPLPLRLRDELQRMLADRGMEAGARLPSEADLARHFDVARTTVREALKLLEQEGIVEAQHGRGRFVTGRHALARPLSRLEGVTDMLAGHGFRPTNRVLGSARRPAREAETDALGLATGEEVLEIERLRCHEDVPLVYSVDVLPARLIGDAEPDWTGSLFAVLDRAGARIVAATAEVSAAPLPAAVVRRLKLPRHPWLLMVQRHRTRDGRAVLLSRDFHAGESFSFHLLRSRDA